MRHLEIVPGRYAVCKLRYITRTDLALLVTEPFYSITKSPEETTVVCRESTADVFEWVKEGRENGFVALRVAGQIAFDEAGVLAQMSDVLAEKDISIFAISTYDTDYILMREESQKVAIAALEKAGYEVKRLQRAVQPQGEPA
jgi:hypothetical protein